MKKIQEHFRSHWSFYVLALLGFYFNYFRITGFNLENIAGDLGDTRFIMAIVEYNYQWLIGTYNNYWDGFFMVPDKEVISYSDNLLGSLPIYSIFRLIGFDYIDSFQLLILSANFLNFFLTYIFLIKQGSRSVSSSTGAYIFTFCIGLVSLYNHPQYALRFAIPIFILFVLLYLKTKNTRHLIFASLTLVYQFYLNIYLGYFLFVCGAIFFLCDLIINRKSIEFLKIYISDGLKMLPILILLFPLFYHYLHRNIVTGYYTDYEFYMQTLPRISSYFKAFEGSLVWTFLNSTPVYSKYPWLHNLFPGLLVITSMFVGLILLPTKNKTLKVVIFTLIVIFSFTTYYEGHTLYGYVMKIPGIKSARVVSRIVLLILFFSGWLLALELDLIFEKLNTSRNLISILLIACVVLDNSINTNMIKKFTKTDCAERVSILEKKHNTLNSAMGSKIVAFTNFDTINSHHYHIDAMLCALKLGAKTVNGYSSTCHAKFGRFWRQPNETELNYWLDSMNFSKDSVFVIK